MLDYASRILLRDPLNQRQELFAHVIYNDLLHWELNVCDYTFAAIVGVMTPSMKLECDANTYTTTTHVSSTGRGTDTTIQDGVGKHVPHHCAPTNFDVHMGSRIGNPCTYVA